MTAPVRTRDTIFLTPGNHGGTPLPPPDETCEVCFFEAYNLLYQDPKLITDNCPPGVCFGLYQYGMALNDCVSHELRPKLKELLPDGGPSPLAGTATDGHNKARSYLALDWLVRTCTAQ